MADLETFVTSLAGSVAGFGAAAWLARAWLGARIKGEVEHVYAERLETHKADLNRKNEVAIGRLRADALQQQDVANVAMSAFAATQNAILDRRVQAVERVWKAAMQFRDAATHELGLLFVLTREEVEGALDDPKLSSKIGPFSPDALASILRAQSDIELHRPFIDDVLWSAYFGYRAFHGRLVVLLAMGRKAGKLTFWRDDPGIQQILAAMLTKEEISNVGGWYTNAQGYIEAALLRAARDTLSGRSASDGALAHAQQVIAAVRAVEN